ncbi:hypothetical protein A1Q2_01979 [Trichosporon asahii var. asahii CBS 8904]|uniref:DNA polymerase delta subunit 4 n=1 Tax=Trichosporon asahii var. asahii (strain CBS 8904) TaxID=1220162 RepID=K1W4G4_TRIAC|nr:hypothetical protein A1Q2_01979 [Trichosporon asahii var. asahii CBS 8904]
MPPRRSTKQSSGLTQPTLSFQTRRPTRGSAKSAAKKAASPPVARRTSSSVSSAEPVTPAEAVVDLTSNKEPERPDLHPNSKQWDGLYKAAKQEMGGLPPIHAGPEVTKVHHILRVFDLTSKYGPCAGMTRLERWNRAKKWGLNPPEGIKDILETKQGEDDVSFRDPVSRDWV